MSFKSDSDSMWFQQLYAKDCSFLIFSLNFWFGSDISRFWYILAIWRFFFVALGWVSFALPGLHQGYVLPRFEALWHDKAGQGDYLGVARSCKVQFQGFHVIVWTCWNMLEHDSTDSTCGNFEHRVSLDDWFMIHQTYNWCRVLACN